MCHLKSTFWMNSYLNVNPDKHAALWSVTQKCNWHPKVKEMKVAQSRPQSWLLRMQNRGFAVESTRGEPYVWFILLAVSFVSSGVGSSLKRAKWIFFLVLPDTLALTYTEVPWGMNLWNYSACGGTSSQVGLGDCYPQPHSMRCLCSQMWHSFLIGLFWDLITHMVVLTPICGDFTLLTSHFFLIGWSTWLLSC